MALKIPDVFGIVSERARQRELYGEQAAKRRADAFVLSPAGQARINREVDARVKAEVDAIIERKRQERLAELEQIAPPPGPPIGEILVLVSDVTGCTVSDIVGPRRARNCAWPRFLAVHLLVVMRPDLSLPAIGHAIGGRDHTTVMHSRNQFAKLYDQEPFARWLDHPRVREMLARAPRPGERCKPNPFRQAA